MRAGTLAAAHAHDPFHIAVGSGPGELGSFGAEHLQHRSLGAEAPCTQGMVPLHKLFNMISPTCTNS